MKKENIKKETSWFLDGDGNIPSGFDEKGNFNTTEYDPSKFYKIKGKTFRLKSNPSNELEDPFDLNNLRFINPEKVINALKEIENLNKLGKKLVCMIGTGGTISMTLQKGKLKPGLNPKDLLNFAGGGLDDRFFIVSFELGTQIDSSQMEIDYIKSFGFFCKKIIN